MRALRASLTIRDNTVDDHVGFLAARIFQRLIEARENVVGKPAPLYFLCHCAVILTNAVSFLSPVRSVAFSFLAWIVTSGTGKFALFEFTSTHLIVPCCQNKKGMGNGVSFKSELSCLVHQSLSFAFQFFDCRSRFCLRGTVAICDIVERCCTNRPEPFLCGNRR